MKVSLGLDKILEAREGGEPQKTRLSMYFTTAWDTSALLPRALDPEKIHVLGAVLTRHV